MRRKSTLPLAGLSTIEERERERELRARPGEVIMQWEILCAEILFIEPLPLCPSPRRVP